MVVEQNLKQTTKNYLEDTEYDDLNRSTMERIMSEFEKREDNEESEAGKLSRYFRVRVYFVVHFVLCQKRSCTTEKKSCTIQNMSCTWRIMVLLTTA